MTRSEPAADGSRLSFVLLIILIIALWFAGGASRADAAGQVLVRSTAWLTLVVAILLGPTPQWRRFKAPIVFLCLAIALLLLQLLPLPPALWTALPGRAILEEATRATQQPAVWRPISISPSATLNALGSLVVPIACLYLLLGLSPRQHHTLFSMLAVVILMSCILGAFQASGARFDHPMLNDVAGDVSSSFANRNHFALFVAIGCAIVPALASRWGRRLRAGAIITMGVIVFFLLMLMVVGSRSGLVLGLVGTIGGGLVARRWIAAQFASVSRYRALLAVGLVVAVIASALVASIMLNRAAAVERVMDLRSMDDLRGQIRPTVFAIIGGYFPFGTGFGTFDIAYRMAEPAELLRFTYVNQAHNDLLSVPLEGGLPALALLLAGAGWAVRASIRAWRADGGLLARAGSVIILLILIASATDYPARTPMIMAVLAFAFAWLADPHRSGGERTRWCGGSSGFTPRNAVSIGGASPR